MCTLVIDVAPQRRYAVLLAAVRDEMLGRAWDPPARHWPDRPGLIGGRDRLAGGTWLAFDPAARRVACVLNGTGPPAVSAHRRSRGELPLAAAAGETVPDELTRFDPFHLVVADTTSIEVLSWDGRQPCRYRPGPGTQVFVNQGRWGGSIDAEVPRAVYFGPLFAARQPEPDADGPVASAWAPWASLIDEPAVAPADPRALVTRGHGGSWGTSSITLLGFGAQAGQMAGRARYDFRVGPEAHPWTGIATDDPPYRTPPAVTG